MFIAHLPAGTIAARLFQDRRARIALLVGTGLIVYAAVAWLIGAVDKEDLAILARRRSAKPIDEEIPGF